MKLKKLQKLLSKELQECGVSKDKEGLRATLMDKVINHHHETNLATLPAVSLPLIQILEHFVY
jgi:cell growth-regulating nucleolar protein